jgi:hypothetical protein
MTTVGDNCFHLRWFILLVLMLTLVSTAHFLSNSTHHLTKVSPEVSLGKNQHVITIVERGMLLDKHRLKDIVDDDSTNKHIVFTRPVLSTTELIVFDDDTEMELARQLPSSGGWDLLVWRVTSTFSSIDRQHVLLVVASATLFTTCVLLGWSVM